MRIENCWPTSDIGRFAMYHGQDIEDYTRELRVRNLNKSVY